MSDLSLQAYLIDSHCHLADPAFAADRSEVVERGRRAGVRRIIAIGTGESPDNNRVTVALAEQHDEVWAAVAVHPHEAAAAEGRWGDGLGDLWSHEKVVAVGETGLDFHYQHSPVIVQEEAFRFFLATAKRISLPVVIHCRDAFPRMLEILREEKMADTGGVIHCFGGGWQEAKQSFDLNFDISISGIVTFKNATRLREVVRRAPLDRMLLETDAPYLAPEPGRGKRNEPASVLHTAKMVAAIKNMPLAEVAGRSTAAAERRFALPSLGC